MPRKQYIAANILLQRLRHLEDTKSNKEEKDIKSRKVYPICYKSGIWLQVERKYNATKREYKGVLKILKKL